MARRHDCHFPSSTTKATSPCFSSLERPHNTCWGWRDTRTSSAALNALPTSWHNAFSAPTDCRRQELPLSGGNGNPTSGYEANERCAADHATRPAAHRVDHTSISATTPDDLRSRSGRSRTAAVHSVNVCMHRDWHVDQSMLFALWCFTVWISVRLHVRRLHRCLLRIRPLASEKRLDQMKTCAARQWNLRQHPTLALLEHSEAPWRLQVLLLPGASFSTVMVKQGSVPIMANFEPFFLRSVNECGADCWWKNSQDIALQEIPRRNSVLYFWAGPSLVEVAVRTASWLVSAISHRRRVCAPMLMFG